MMVTKSYHNCTVGILAKPFHKDKKGYKLAEGDEPFQEVSKIELAKDKVLRFKRRP